MGRKKYSKKKQSTTKAITQLKKDVRDLKNRPEWKQIDDSMANIGIISTGNMTLLNGVAQGTTADSIAVREGNEIYVRKIIVRGYVHNDNTSPQDCVVRLMLVRQRDVSNTAITVTNVLKTAHINSHRAFEELYNVKVLWDNTFAMDDSTHTIVPFKITHKCNYKCIYDGAGASYTAVEKGGYYILYISNIATGSNEEPRITCTWRVYFQDM